MLKLQTKHFALLNKKKKKDAPYTDIPEKCQPRFFRSIHALNFDRHASIEFELERKFKMELNSAEKKCKLTLIYKENSNKNTPEKSFDYCHDLDWNFSQLH